jgi:hypothetical protein
MKCGLCQQKRGRWSSRMWPTFWKPKDVDFHAVEVAEDSSSSNTRTYAYYFWSPDSLTLAAWYENDLQITVVQLMEDQCRAHVTALRDPLVSARKCILLGGMPVDNFIPQCQGLIPDRGVLPFITIAPGFTQPRICTHTEWARGEQLCLLACRMWPKFFHP